MAEKTKFSNLLSLSADMLQQAALAPTQKACGNCVHARAPAKIEGTKPYVMCKKNPPTPVIQPVGLGTGQLTLGNRWPAMGLDEECDAFTSVHNPSKN